MNDDIVEKQKSNKQKVKLKITRQEQAFYQDLFDLHSENHKSKKDQKIMTSEKCKEIFQKSGLKNAILMEIWDKVIEGSDKDYLRRTEFFTALKCIAICQNYKGSLNEIYQTFIGSANVPLPQLNLQEEQKKDQFNIEEEIKDQLDQLDSLDLQYDESFKQNNELSESKPIIDSFQQEQQKPIIKQFQEEVNQYANQEDSLKVTISEQQTITKSYFQSFTVYKIVTISKLPRYDQEKVYVVQHRYSDFEWLQKKLLEKDEYKGLIIPPLPEKKYFGNLNDQFVEERKQQLQTFLTVLSQHHMLKFDSQLFMFLTLSEGEFENYKTDPAPYLDKFYGFYQFLPSFKNLSYQSMQTLINQGYLEVKTEFQQFNEPNELKIYKNQQLFDINTKEKNVLQNLQIMQSLQQSLKKQKEVSQQRELGIENIGNLLYKIMDLGEQKEEKKYYRELEFYSDQQKLDEEIKESQYHNKIENEYEIQQMNNKQQMSIQIKKFFRDVSLELEKNNQNKEAELYIIDKIAKLQGIFQALQERKTYIKSYQKKIQLKVYKNEQLQQVGMDSSKLFELNNQIEALQNEISNIKQTILTCNDNILKELELLEQIQAGKIILFMKQYGRKEYDMYYQEYKQFQENYDDILNKIN